MIRVGSPEDHGLALAAIQIDGGTQSRATLNDHVVNEYAEAIKAGATFPPIVVFYDGKKHWLADGFHRFHAYQKIGREKVAADIRQGTRRDAILHSVGANEAHGLRRTNDDKRRAALTLLNDSEWSKWSDGEIAKRCAVSREYVNRLRPKDTCDQVTGMERTFVHPKTGEPTTIKMRATVAPASAKEHVTLAREPVQSDDTLARAPLESEANVTSPDAVGDTDAIRAGHITQYHVMRLREAWSKANAEARAIFLAEFNLRQESNPATATGGIDVDRSAERASSAVEVGAPVSPEGATQVGENVSTSTAARNDAGKLGVTAGETALEFQAKASEDNGATGEATMRRAESMAGEVSRSSDRDECGAATSERMDVTGGESAATSFIAAPGVAAEVAGNDLREPVAAEQGQIIREGDAPRETGRSGGVASCPDTEFQSDGDAFSEVKGTARPESAAGVEPSSSEAVADPQAPRPSATAPLPPDHATPAGDDGRPSKPGPDDAGAKSDGLQSVVGQDGEQPGIHHGKSGQEPVGNPQDGNSAVSGEPASVTNSKPDCLHPDTCKLHFTSALCWSCNDARMRRAGA